jgi:hypothetical protein
MRLTKGSDDSQENPSFGEFLSAEIDEDNIAVKCLCGLPVANIDKISHKVRN